MGQLASTELCGCKFMHVGTKDKKSLVYGHRSVTRFLSFFCCKSLFCQPVKCVMHVYAVIGT